MSRVEEVAKLAIKSFEAQEKGNTRASDRYNLSMKKVIVDMYENGEIGSLKPLMYYNHDAVRCEVAIKLLPFFTEEAESILEELAQKRGNLIYATAKTTLEEWRKGNIKFSYYKK